MPPSRSSDHQVQTTCRISATRVQSKAAAHRSDGDTIAIGTRHVRFEGIDAPETDQVCLNTKGKYCLAKEEAVAREQLFADAVHPTHAATTLSGSAQTSPTYWLNPRTGLAAVDVHADHRGDRMRFGFGLASTREEVDTAIERMAKVLAAP
jgi:cysteine sulfinate desulfinase/cysteine desulfurase-like protein